MADKQGHRMLEQVAGTPEHCRLEQVAGTPEHCRLEQVLCRLLGKSTVLKSGLQSMLCKIVQVDCKQGRVDCKMVPSRPAEYMQEQSRLVDYKLEQVDCRQEQSRLAECRVAAHRIDTELEIRAQDLRCCWLELLMSCHQCVDTTT